MMAFRRFTSLAAALILGACVALPEMSMDSGMSGEADLFTFGVDGVVGFAPETAYSTAAVEAALPGYSATTIEMATEERTLSGIGVFKDGLQILQLVPGAGGRVAAVHGVSTRVRGPGGARIGMTLREARIDRADCREGDGNWRGMTLCTARGAPAVTLVFSIPGYVDTVLPDEATLAGATLQRLVWTLPGSAA